MAQATVKEKIVSLEAEIRLLKGVLQERPNFSIDQSNWRKIRLSVKRARKKVFQELYG